MMTDAGTNMIKLSHVQLSAVFKRIGPKQSQARDRTLPQFADDADRSRACDVELHQRLSGRGRMGSEVIIALLAVFTIGIVLVISVFHFGYFLKDPRNRGAARNVLVEDGPSATTEVRSGGATSRAFGGLAEDGENAALGTSHAQTGVMPDRAGGQPPGL